MVNVSPSVPSLAMYPAFQQRRSPNLSSPILSRATQKMVRPPGKEIRRKTQPFPSLHILPSQMIRLFRPNPTKTFRHQGKKIILRGYFSIHTAKRKLSSRDFRNFPVFCDDEKAHFLRRSESPPSFSLWGTGRGKRKEEEECFLSLSVLLPLFPWRVRGSRKKTCIYRPPLSTCRQYSSSREDARERCDRTSVRKRKGGEKKPIGPQRLTWLSPI